MDVSDTRRSAVVKGQPFEHRDIIAAARRKGHSLMDRVKGHVQHRRRARHRGTARLFDHERERRALVHQTEFPFRVAPVGRVQVDAAFNQAPVDIGDECSRVAERITALGASGELPNGRYTPKMVATTPLTSAFDDPSSGSTHSTYDARVPQAI